MDPTLWKSKYILFLTIKSMKFRPKKIIVRAQLIQLLCGLVTKNLNQRISGPNCNGKGKASPVITLLSILLHWIRTSKELQSPLRLLGMALSCAGLILHLGSRVVRGDSFNPKVCCWRERANSSRKSITVVPSS
jgi:hypothetical protein